MKARELVKMMEAAGAVRVRNSGGHRMYRFPSGVVVGISYGGAQTEVSDGLLGKVRRAMRTKSRE